MSFFSVKKFFQSLKYAWRGIKSVYRTEQNFRFELLAGLLVVGAMIFFQVNRKEAVLLILVIVLVLVMEMINSVFEKMVDMLKPKIHVYAELIKDIMSGAVLVTSLAAIVIGVIVFMPYIIILLKFHN